MDLSANLSTNISRRIHNRLLLEEPHPARTETAERRKKRTEDFLGFLMQNLL
jgi:hypothetical protein